MAVVVVEERDVCCQMAAQPLGPNGYRNRKEQGRSRTEQHMRIDRKKGTRNRNETWRRERESKEKSEIPLNPIRCRRA